MAEEVKVKVTPDRALEHLTLQVSTPSGLALIAVRVNTRQLVQAAQGVGVPRSIDIPGVLVQRSP